jgi:mono/diheme cytochrome c family protein
MARLVPILGIVGLLGAGAAPALGESGASQITRGERLLTANCARCHSVGRTGTSPHAEAPPFRIISQRYPIEGLAEALAEGISVGHPDMPEFAFEPEDVGAILAYLKSIQER